MTSYERCVSLGVTPQQWVGGGPPTAGWRRVKSETRACVCMRARAHTHTRRVADQLLGNEVRFLPNSVSFLPFVGGAGLIALEEN